MLARVEQETPQHESFIRLVDRPNEGWFNYRFHIPGDPGRELYLAVVLFHLPEVG